MDVSVIMQLEFQQSSFETVEMPQIQFIDRLPDIPIVTQRWVLTVQTVQKPEIPRVQRVAADVSVNIQRQAPAVHLQKLFRKPTIFHRCSFLRRCGRPCAHARPEGASDSVIDKVMTI